MKTITLILLLIPTVAQAQYKLEDYLHSVDQQAYNVAGLQRMAMARTGYTYTPVREIERRPKQSTADLYSSRSSNLSMKMAYEQELQDARLKTRQRRLDMALAMYELKEQEETYQALGYLPPRKPSSIVIDGKQYPNYKTFASTPEGRQWRMNRKKLAVH